MTGAHLDDLDRRLIDALQHDGRASYADLAELVNLSPQQHACGCNACSIPAS